MKNPLGNSFCKRKNFPQDIKWGDIVDATIEEIEEFGVFFSYKGVRGFLDWIRLPNNEDYKRFTEGHIKPGEIYKIRVGIIYNSKREIQLISRPDVNEIEFIKTQYNEFKSILDIMERCLIKGYYLPSVIKSSLDSCGITSYIVFLNDKTLESKYLSMYKCFCTFEESQFLKDMFEKFGYKNIDIPLLVCGFDDQLLVIYLRVDWLNLFERIKELENL